MPEPYSRIYWRIRDEFPAVYQDEAVLGAWVKLLMIAEGAHPSAADLPRTVKQSSIAKLVDEGLVVLYPGARYRIKGLAQERERRTEAARVGGLASGRSRSPRTDVERPLNDRSTNGEPRRDETRQAEDETSTQRASGPLSLTIDAIQDAIVGNDPIPVDVRRLQRLAADLTGDPFVNVHSGLGLKAVNEQLPHGFDRVEKAWRQVDARVRAASGPGVKPTLRQLVFGADEVLNVIPKPDAGERREDEAREAYDRRVARTAKQIAEYRN